MYHFLRSSLTGILRGIRNVSPFSFQKPCLPRRDTPCARPPAFLVPHLAFSKKAAGLWGSGRYRSVQAGNSNEVYFIPKVYAKFINSKKHNQSFYILTPIRLWLNAETWTRYKFTRTQTRIVLINDWKIIRFYFNICF